MLIEVPRGPSGPLGPKPGDTKDAFAAKDAFEEALQRDLSAAPVVAYGAVLGGWVKRAIELCVTLISLPLWAPVLIGAALVSELRDPSGSVFVTDERIGYGGKAFKRYRLRLAPSHAPAGNEQNGLWSKIETEAEGRFTKWRLALEYMPQLLNVLLGEMSLVGPQPLSQDAVGELKSAKRYYLSCRPGAIGVNAIATAFTSDEQGDPYKLYVICWSVRTDALLAWDGVKVLRKRGELWQPGLRLAQIRAKAGARAVVVRRRSAPPVQDTV